MQNESPISLRILLFCLVASVVILSYLTYDYIRHQHSFVVFCNVSKGYAVYIRSKKGLDVVVNTGPDKKIIECLSRYMPFFDRRIEYFILTNSSQSYIGGASYLLNRYRISNFYIADDIFAKNSTLNGVNKEKFNSFNTKRLSMVDSIYIEDSVFYIKKISSSVTEKYLLTFDTNQNKIYLMAELSGRTINNLLRSCYSCHDTKRVILQLPYLALDEKLLSILRSLADKGIVVIKATVTSQPSIRLSDMKERLNSIKFEYLISNQGKDIVISLN